MATEYLYEHIVFKLSEKNDSAKPLIAVLQDSPRGGQLARMVIRVDTYSPVSRTCLQSTMLRLCPNLQSIYANYRQLHYPYPYSIRRRNLPILSIVSGLLQAPTYQPFWSRADHWHYLTVYFNMPELSADPDTPMTQNNILPPPPDSGGKEFINLRHIHFVSKGANNYSIQNLKHWPLPSITHLTIKSYIPGAGGSYDEILDVLQSSRLGAQLRFFALLVHFSTPSSYTTVCGSLELLKAMPNLEEVALPFFWDSTQLPNSASTFPNVHTMGMETDRWGYISTETPESAFATYTETCCRLFPNMRMIRSISTVSTYDVRLSLTNGFGPMKHFKMAASFLERRGIKFEDCIGCNITPTLF